MRAKNLQSLSCAVLAMTGLASTSAFAGSAPTGVWIDHTGRGGVEIKDCGDGKLCGHVVWIKDSGDAKGCGLQILGNVKSVGSNQWDNGWIYSPEKKQKFSVELTPLDDNRLRVKGYKGIKLLSRTMIWHRASGNLKRCDSTTTAKAPATPSPSKTADIPSQPDTKTSDVGQPRILNPAPTKESKDAASAPRQRTAKVTPGPNRDEPASGRRLDRTRDDKSASIYAEPPRDERDNRARDDERDGDGGSGTSNGLAALLENFASEDGIEVGDGYGMKIEKGPDGEKICRLDVPFVTVNIPCED